MLKASALYIVIVIALVIATLCSSLIVSAYFYRLQYQKTSRYDKLQNNLSSAENIFIANQDTSYSDAKNFSLFNGTDDSVSIQKMFWGVFDIGIIKSFIQSDTLFKVFSVANTIDSTKWAALYLADNNRPLSVSGKTLITGNVFIPKSGVNQSSIGNQSYSENKNIIIGRKFTSQSELPNFDQTRLLKLQQLKEQNDKNNGPLQFNGDSINCSFLSPTRIINLGSEVTTLQNIK